MKVLVTGASGQIGRSLVSQLNRILPGKTDHISILLHDKPLPDCFVDFTDQFTVVREIKSRFDIAIHLAAIISTPFCQKPENRDLVVATNVELTKTVCDHSDFVVMLSTDNVFKGDERREYGENEEPNPVNFYGTSKLKAEKIVMSSNGAVVRVQTMLGCSNLIINAVIDMIRGKPHPPFWNDTFSRPAFLPDLMQILGVVIRNKISGIFHCSTMGEVFSRAQIAKMILQFFRDHNLPRVIDSILEESCSVPAFPRHLVLNTELTRNQLGLTFTPSHQALAEHLAMFLDLNRGSGLKKE